MMNDGELRQALRSKGLIRAGEFTWDAAAQKTLAVYHTVGGR
jgi:hypothetical protein